MFFLKKKVKSNKTLRVERLCLEMYGNFNSYVNKIQPLEEKFGSWLSIEQKLYQTLSKSTLDSNTPECGAVSRKNQTNCSTKRDKMNRICFLVYGFRLWIKEKLHNFSSLLKRIKKRQIRVIKKNQKRKRATIK